MRIKATFLVSIFFLMALLIMSHVSSISAGVEPLVSINKFLNGNQQNEIYKSLTGKPVIIKRTRLAPPNPTAEIPWMGGTSGVADIEAAFNNARTFENMQLGISIPMMSLPSQAVWDTMSNGQKGLWLINRERIDRGVHPLHGIESNVTSVAQYYAQYLLDNNAFSHNADGKTPWQRLDTKDAIRLCHDSLPVAENLAIFWTSGSSVSLAVERAIYMWMYTDGPSWGHRYAILYYPYNDNSGPLLKEGFLGIGRAAGGPHSGWPHAAVVVMNVFDPCSTWIYPKNDFNTDGQEDIIWRHYGTGGNVLWYLSSSAVITGLRKGNVETMSRAQGPSQAQIYQDAREAGKIFYVDERIYHDVWEVEVPKVMISGANVYRDAREAGEIHNKEGERGIASKVRELMKSGNLEAGVQAISVTGTTYLSTISDVYWGIGGTGDFNSDGNVDILWRHYTTGRNALWYMNGSTVTGTAYLTTITNVNWHMAGTGDFNSDGNVDILWRNYVTGQNVLWYMNGSTIIGTAFLSAVTDTSWRIGGTGDFNSDGKVDILWRHLVSGANVLWHMNGSTITGTAFLTTITNVNWRVEGAGDFNSDGNVDILWRNYVTGQNVLWYMNGSTIIGTEYLTTITDVNWRIENH